MAKEKAAVAAEISGISTGALDNGIQMVAGGDEEDEIKPTKPKSHKQKRAKSKYTE